MSVVLKLALRAMIAGVSALVVASGVGGAGLLGQAQANNPQCVASPTDPCPPPADGSANPPSQARLQDPNPPRMHVYCQPAGKVGAFCYR
jgi:hypothetical protein